MSTVSTKTRNAYGLRIPSTWSQTRIELACYRYSKLRAVSGHPPEEHLLRAIRSAHPPEEYAIHGWTEWRAWSWANHDEITWIGSGSSGKSCDAAMFARMDFMAGPNETSTTIYSTTKNKLRKRIWKDLIRYHEMAPFGMNYRKGDLMITPDKHADTINALSGDGILRDDNTVVVANLFGVHNRRNRVIVDEAQGCPWVVIEGTVNASLGGELEEGSWKVLLMGNPEDEEDTLCRFCAPTGGWLTLDVNDKQWEPSGGGIALHFDGLASPAVVEENGDQKYPFLIRQKDIDKISRRFPEDSIRYMSQVRGWLVRGSHTDRVIDYPLMDQFNVWDQGVRMGPVKVLAAADPAFSSGGDRCQMKFADMYPDDFGVQIIEFTGEYQIPIQATDERSMTYMMVDQIRDACEERGIDPRRLALDITGQQKLLPDVITEEWGPGSHRVDFNGPASSTMFDHELNLTAKDVYFNRVTELWMRFVQFVKAGQIRGMDRDTAKEWTSRRIMWRGNRQQVEKKDDMRRRLGYSPDKADAQAILLDMVQVRFGVEPGVGRPEAIDYSDSSDYFLDVPMDWAEEELG